MVRRKAIDPTAALFSGKDNDDFSFIDLFAGIGGFRLGMQSVGGKCVFSSEWEESARLTYLANYGELPYGDITNKETKSHIPEHFDVLCAGFPCQPYSISGLRNGLEDRRANLFFEICEIAEKHKPKVLFLENVKNIIHIDEGRTWKLITRSLRKLGYKVSWKIMNAADYGVPQNRERCIIVASLDKKFNFSKVKKVPRRPLRDFLDEVGPYRWLDPKMYTIIDEKYWKAQKRSGMMFCGYRVNSIRKVILKKYKPGVEIISGSHKQNFRIYSVGGIYPTILAHDTTGRLYICLDDKRVRSLTVRECWRMMGFPEEFTSPVAKTHQIKQIGNSVCVTMVQAISKEIKAQLLDPQDNNP